MGKFIRKNATYPCFVIRNGHRADDEDVQEVKVNCNAMIDEGVFIIDPLEIRLRDAQTETSIGLDLRGSERNSGRNPEITISGFPRQLVQKDFGKAQH